ncbi:S-layer homology domain-containing protein [Domibacillus epiphyticus]|uniref:SLH domain-containing protein n=1 Tax=Domibacillus epiphyticus TaxID=1714355 RepID=A0A1V2ABC3_9BACI|nr:S-layer homology domain-containing protein [Domibacillus epiphyticus]OMP68094.1 hypothetical protein BTO28_03845 [Domibacillus epiphyticus]
MKKIKNKKFGATLLSSVLLFSAVSPVLADDRDGEIVEFSDTKKIGSFSENIGRMKVKGVFQGNDDGTFNPYAPVTRIQSVITAVRLLGLEDQAEVKKNVKLPFKDASSFNARVHGYLAVALEQGLIDSSTQNFLPNKPADRLWVSSLLVRTLGLEDEAALAKGETLDFKDANKIPASVKGDVFVANEYGVFSGNNDGLFLPNEPIKRVHMAAVLDRTYDQLLEENGAATIKGVVTNVSKTDGTITVKTFTGESVTVNVPADVLVQFHNRFMAMDQVLAGDNIELNVENNVVVDAAIFQKPAQTESENGIQKIEIELELKDGSEIELEFESKRGKVKAEVKTDGKKAKGDAAIAQIEQYLTEWNLTPDMTEEEIKTIILSSFTEEAPAEIEIELKFSNGTKLELEKEDDDDKDEDRDEDDRDDGGKNDDRDDDDRNDGNKNNRGNDDRTGDVKNDNPSEVPNPGTQLK